MSLSRLAWEATAPARPAPPRDIGPGKSNRDGFDSLVKYIPTETITIFVALCSAKSAIETIAGFSYLYVYLACAVLTPLLLWLIAFGRHRQSAATTTFKSHWWPFAAATVAFLVWAMSVPGMTSVLASDEAGQAAWGIIAGVGAVVVSLLLSILEPVLGPKPGST